MVMQYANPWMKIILIITKISMEQQKLRVRLCFVLFIIDMD